MSGPPRSRPPFRVTLYADIEVDQRKAWLIDDLLGAGEITAFYGPPGGGKSVLLGDAAAHVAAGLPWFGKAVQRGVVVIVAAERGALTKRRLAAWRKRYGHEDIPLIVVEGVFDFCTDIAHAAEIVRIAAAAAERYGLPVVWVIIDTKAHVMAGADPNSDADTMTLVKTLAIIRQDTGAHVTVVDHVPHYAPDRMKGSGALAGAVDGSFLVTKVRRGLHRVTIGSKPPNDGPDELDLAFRLEGVVICTDEAGKDTSAPVVVASDPEPPLTGSAGKRVKVSHGGQKVLAAFARLHDAGRTHPAPCAPGVRPGTLAVALADLQQTAFDLGLSADIEPKEPGEERDRWRNKRNQAWKRAVEKLQEQGLLRAELGSAWEPGRAGPVTNGDSADD